MSVSSPDGFVPPSKLPSPPQQHRTARKKRAHAGGFSSRITHETWEALLAAWRERPSINNLTKAVPGVGYKLATRAVNEGWPEMGFPPLTQVDVTAVNAKMKGLREDREERRTAENEAVRRAAEEADAARVGLSLALSTARAAQKTVERVLELVERDGVKIEEVTPGLLVQISRMSASVAEAIERSIKVSRLAAGEPEQVLGVQVGVLLSGCTPAELREIVEMGHFPKRLLGFSDASGRAVLDAPSTPVLAGE